MNTALPELYDMDMPIRAFVTKRVIGIPADRTVQEAAQRMVDFNISSIAVTEEEKIVGLLTDRDIKERVVAEGRGPDATVKEVMTGELITTDIGTKVRDVLALLAEQNVKHVLVAEEGEIVGIMTFRDLIDMERHSLETHISRE